MSEQGERKLKRTEVVIAAIGLALTTFLTLSNNIQTWRYRREQVLRADIVSELMRWEIESSGSMFAYSLTFKCDSDTDFQLIESLEVENIGGQRAENFHIVIHDTYVEVLKAWSDWDTVEPEIRREASKTRVRVPPFPLDAGDTYTLKMHLADYGSTDVGRVRDIASVQEGALDIAARNKLAGESRRKFLKVEFVELETYKVQDSDTLEEIADRFQVHIDDLVVYNNLDSLADPPIEPGQDLVIRRAECGRPEIPAGRRSIICYHVTQPCEDIFCIARAYGVDPWAIAEYNAMAQPESVRAGITLAIPNAYTLLSDGPTCAPQCPPETGYPCTCAYYHTLSTGESLYDVSLRYGVSLWRIADCNNIYNLNYIRAGDVLCIP